MREKYAALIELICAVAIIYVPSPCLEKVFMPTRRKSSEFYVDHKLFRIRAFESKAIEQATKLELLQGISSNKTKIGVARTSKSQVRKRNSV